MIASVSQFNRLSIDKLHVQYLDLMPGIERHARTVFRHLKCPDQHDDKIAECLALAWKWLVRLHQRGMDVSYRSSTVFIFRVAQAVRSGRRVAGRDRARDVMSPRAQQRHGFTVTSLPSSSTASHDKWYSQARGQRRQDEFTETLRDQS